MSYGLQAKSDLHAGNDAKPELLLLTSKNTTRKTQIQPLYIQLAI